MNVANDPQPAEPTRSGAGARRAVRRTIGLVVATAVLAVSSVALGATLGHDEDRGSPAETVRDFLTVAAVDGNGVAGCRYLTSAAVRRLEAAEPSPSSCEIALWSARLELGGRVIDQESEVKGLTYRVEQRGGVARVTVSAGGGAHTFVLRRATASELREFQAPATTWRIDSGVDGLVSR